MIAPRHRRLTAGFPPRHLQGKWQNDNLGESRTHLSLNERAPRRSLIPSTVKHDGENEGSVFPAQVSNKKILF